MSSEVHTINVGSGGQHVFEPDTVYANAGDLITFKFYPTNHSVVRGEYTQSRSCGNSGCNPCVPYELFHPDEEGFQSGNIETQDGSGHVRHMV
jgi:plastocyanin